MRSELLPHSCNGLYYIRHLRGTYFYRYNGRAISQNHCQRFDFLFERFEMEIFHNTDHVIYPLTVRDL